MKTFYSKALKYTAALLLCTATAGCTSFLDEKTYSFVSGDDLYTTAANAELALTGVYDILNAGAIQGTGNQPLWGRGMHYLMMLGDEIAPNGISDPHHQIIASCGYNEEADFVSMAWFGLFVGIDRANHIIQKVPAIDMDPKRRDEIVNEAKLLRGLYRLYQAWLWGEVPLPNTPNSSAEAPREPLDKVYACIEEDLDKAYKELPDRNSNVNGRVNKWTAGGYLLKMYTYLASCKENRVGQELGSPTNSFDWVDAEACWKKAAAIAEDIYAHSGYKLIKPYHYNFLADTKSSQKEECMMVVQTGAGGSNEYFLFADWAGPQGTVGTNGGGYGWIRPRTAAWAGTSAAVWATTSPITRRSTEPNTSVPWRFTHRAPTSATANSANRTPRPERRRAFRRGQATSTSRCSASPTSYCCTPKHFTRRATNPLRANWSRRCANAPAPIRTANWTNRRSTP